MNRWIQMILVLLSILLMAWPACAFETPKHISIVMRDGDNLPYQHVPGKGQPEGIYVELVKQAASKAGIEVSIIAHPWKRCVRMTQAGVVDAIIGPFQNQKNTDYLFFVEEPLAYEETALFTYKGSKVSFRGNLAEVFHCALGKVRGATFFDEWATVETRFKIVEESSTVPILLKKLSRKRLDLIIGNKLVIEYNVKKLGVSDVIVDLSPSLELHSGHLAFSRAKGESHRILAQKFNEIIKEIKASDAYVKILDKYSEL